MLKPWKDIAVPHRDILEGRLEESTFMADLANVAADRGPVEYRDAGLFFRKTYPTEGLVRLLADVLRRLSGKGGEAVIQLQTPFGGGKSHSLIALYHLFRSGNDYRDLELVKEVLEAAGVEEIPHVKTPVFVGTSADPLKGKTPWGELGEQLSRYELVRDHDLARTSPGREVLHKLLGDEPVLILMDEIAEYVARCVSPREIEQAGTSPEAARVYQTQVLTFFQELTETLSAKPNVTLVVTLPSSVPYGEEGERALNQLVRIFGRMEAVYEPVRGLEIYEVVRRRLFESIGDRDDVRATVEGYWGLYQRLGEEIPRWAKEPAYKEKMLHAYPFHPELIDLLFERWATIPTFQVTRGVLRLLALVVADLYRNNHSAPLIHPSHVNLRNPEVKRELLKHIESDYNSVIASDIVDSNAKAQLLDRQMGEFARYRLASGLATAIFLYSFSGGKRRGVELSRLTLAVLEPDFQVPLVGDTLRRLRDTARLWYLHEEEGLLFFHKTPNLNGVIVDKELQITPEQVTEGLLEHIRKHLGSELKVVPFPKKSEDIGDTPELKLAVLSPEVASEPEEALREFVGELMEKAGSKYRVYKNALVVLAPTAEGIEAARNAMRRYLALHAIKDDRSLYGRLSEADKKRLEHEIRNAALEVPERIMSAYRLLFRPGTEDPEDLGLATVGERTSLSKRAREYLKEKELLVESLSPKHLLKALGEKETEKPLKEIFDAFFRYPGFPMPLNKGVLETAVIEGVEAGVFGVRKASGELVYRSPVPRAALEEASLVRKEVAEAELAERKPSIINEEEPPKTEHEAPEKSTTKTEEGWKADWALQIPGERLHDLARGVLAPLIKSGAKVSIYIHIEATSDHKPKDEDLAKIDETVKQLRESSHKND